MQQGEQTQFLPQEQSQPAPAADASTSVDWNREFRQPESAGAIERVEEHEPQESSEPAFVEDQFVEHRQEAPAPQLQRSEQSARTEANFPEFAAPGTLEEETIEEDEADVVRYEGSSDDGYDEFEEETRAVGQDAENERGPISEVRETVAEIHMSSLAESGAPNGESAGAESEEDSEELELEEAQAEAEAMLDAEARGNGAVDARAEVRAPATAGYTQRAPRPRPSLRTSWQRDVAAVVAVSHAASRRMSRRSATC